MEFQFTEMHKIEGGGNYEYLNLGHIKILRGLLGTKWRGQASSWICKSRVQEGHIKLGDINIWVTSKVSRVNEIAKKTSVDEKEQWFEDWTSWALQCWKVSHRETQKCFREPYDLWQKVELEYPWLFPQGWIGRFLSEAFHIPQIMVPYSILDLSFHSTKHMIIFLALPQH